MQSEDSVPSPFHAGETAVQRRLGVAEGIEPWARKVVRPFLPEEHRAFYAALPFVALGARDPSGRPWATLLTGAPGFATAPDPRSLSIRGRPVAGDALEGALTPGADIGLLGIELGTRRRNRMNGRIRRQAPDGMLLEVDQSFGNCPQYITEREWQSVATTGPAPARRSHDHLPESLRDRIRHADTLFIASGHRGEGEAASFGMDVSHRGGARGFVEIEDARTLLLPDYAGNNHFNTIGNLVMNPRAGLLFVDFETGGLLQLTGRAEIDWGSERVADFPEARRLLRFRIEEAVWLEAALPLRWRNSAASLRTLSLVEKTRESDDVTSFGFEARDGAPIADFAAGQHLPLELRLPDRNDPLLRTYSLSNAPGEGRYRISVKREPHGAASRYLHDGVEVGARLAARAPAGDFLLAHSRSPIVLVSAGIGATPMLSMLHSLVQSADPRPVWFVHGARNGRHHAFASEVEQLARASTSVHLHIAYSQPRPEDRLGRDYAHSGRVDGDLLASLLPDLDAEFYLCGPVGFMAEIQAALEQRGVPLERVHSESFGPLA